MPKITIIKIIHFTIDFLLAGFYNYFLNDTIYMEFAKKRADGWSVLFFAVYSMMLIIQSRVLPS